MASRSFLSCIGSLCRPRRQYLNAILTSAHLLRSPKEGGEHLEAYFVPAENLDPEFGLPNVLRTGVRAEEQTLGNFLREDIGVFPLTRYSVQHTIATPRGGTTDTFPDNIIRSASPRANSDEDIVIATLAPRLGRES